MTLPVVANKIELVSDTKLGAAMCNHSAVTGDNANYIARVGNAAWVGNTLKLSGEGLVNYWYVPDVPMK
jgi:hypothetical protein